MWFPAKNDDQNRAVILSGRIALAASCWDEAERLPHSGGLAAKHLLEKWCAVPDAVPTFNGAGVVAFLDVQAGVGHLRTDKIGGAPIFASTGDDHLVIGSHPDSVAAVLKSLGRISPLDEVTMAEFVRTGTATHPHTYYQNIVQLDAASLYNFKLVGTARSMNRVETYWSPKTVRGEKPYSRGEFIESLSHGLREAGRLRTSARMGRPVVLLSAGADSRGVLCALSSPKETQTVTYYDEINPELQRAREISATVGAPHLALKRDPDFYIANATETVRLSGGMWSMESGHHTGFVDDIWSTPGFGTLLTGCYADYLLKGIALNVEPRTLFGKSLPVYKLGAIQQQFHHPLTPISPEFEKRAAERYTWRFAEAIALNDRYAIEYLRISPMSRETDASGRLAFWRQFPIDPILADDHVLDAFSGQSVEDKLSGIAFGMSVARITGPDVARIPNNNYSASVGSGEYRRIADFLRASVGRKINGWMNARTSYKPVGVATFGSWPNFQTVFRQNNVAREWFEQLRTANYYGILGSARNGWSYDDFVERDIIQLMRLLTIYLWRQKCAVVSVGISKL
jgi:asparagine synthase (glutamine-hydrolysing)